MGFHDDVRPEALGEGRYGVLISPAWRVVNGPNGGYLAALAAAAVAAEVGDPERQLRSLTVHYLRIPAEAKAEVQVSVERAGRSISYVTARLVQDGRPFALAMAACSIPRDGVEHGELPPPVVPGPGQGRPWVEVGPRQPFPIHQHWDLELAAGGPPFAQAEAADTTWWIRPKVPTLLDASLLVVVADALPPAIFSALADRITVPTIDLTVHIRADLAALAERWSGSGWILGRFRTGYATAGFLEEDATLWLPDGTLLAHSRQLALAT